MHARDNVAVLGFESSEFGLSGTDPQSSLCAAERQIMPQPYHGTIQIFEGCQSALRGGYSGASHN
jgi:hypothetical protein